MNFAEKFLDLRTQYGYSQEELAERLGVSRQAISKWELGTTLPDTDRIVAISDVFGVSTDYLLKENVAFSNHETLDRVVLRFLGSVQDMENISKELVSIMADGLIDEDERLRMRTIFEKLDTVAAIIDEIKQKANIK